MISALDELDLTEPLATLDEETGEPPETRAVSVMGVRQRINEIRQAETIRSQRRTKILGMLDGNPPVLPSKMKQLNREGDANINFRTGEGTVDAAKTPFYDLTFDADCFARIETDYGDDPQYWMEWSNTISEGFHQMLDEWDGFDGQSQLLDWQMCVHGVGIAMFEDTLNWQWVSRRIGDFLVRDDAKADIDCIEEAVVPRSYMPTELYQLIKNLDQNDPYWN